MKVLFIIAPENFKDEEFFEPYSILEKSGAEIKVASHGVDVAKGTGGGPQPVDMDISEVDVNDFDAFIFIGGPGARVYFDNPDALNIAKEANLQNKIIGGICIAPSILANAGILEGKQATVFESERNNLAAHGAELVALDVVTDENIVTASGPKYATQFGEKIAALLQ